jgi:predicted GIY-YIG superfamily endonuclease
MFLDGCPHTFQVLANKVLPAHMAKMNKAMANPIKMSVLLTGKRATLKKLVKEKDFSGCYVLLKNHKPFYVGISRSVIRRLSQHVKGNTHYSASLAYRMACYQNPHELHRNSAMENLQFQKEFEKSKIELRSMEVAIIEINNPVELYLFEVFCALKTGTHRFNTFATH